MFQMVSAMIIGPAGFRLFQPITSSSRRESGQRRSFLPRRRVVEHKGALRSLRSFGRQHQRHEAVTAGPICGEPCTVGHTAVTTAINGALRGVKTRINTKTVSRGLRLDAVLVGRIERAAKAGGYLNPAAFMRAAIERELAGRESGVDAAEERIAASLDRIVRGVEGIRLGQQALFAFVDALVKTLLTCVPEPPREAYDQAVARGKTRYTRFLKSAGAGMAGDSQAAMRELRQHEQGD